MKIEIIQRIQCAALQEKSRAKYLSDQLKFTEFCASTQIPWDSASVGLWLAHLQLTGAKPLAETTLLQKGSHINFLTQTNPPVLPGGKVDVAKLVQGLGQFSLPTSEKAILPPSFLITISLLENPHLIHVAVEFQAAVGLRAGQMVMVKPQHLTSSKGFMIAPPFKKQKLTLLLNITHIPEGLVNKFLSFSQNWFSPILPWTTPQYRAKFKELCAAYRLPHASHAARHTYATVHRFLNEPLGLIASVLIHKQEKTVETYLHTLSPEEMQVVLCHPHYFRPKLYH